jgi:two-component system KDP operon response regulator KdpE
VNLERKVLIISTDLKLAEPIASALRQSGLVVDLQPSPPESSDHGVALIDLKEDGGWEAAEALGQRFILLVESAAGMRRGFDIGAEDCVLRDGHPEEIAARCEAVLRRTDMPTQPGEETISIYADRRLWVNFGTRQVWVRGQAAKLTPREFRLLEHLIKHHDQTLEHEQILEAVWGRDVEGGRPTEVLKQYVWRLRQKIEPDPNAPDTIVTDPGSGYRFVSRLD